MSSSRSSAAATERGACTAPATLCRPCTPNASAPSSTTRESCFQASGTRWSWSRGRTTTRPCSTTRSSRADGATGPRWPVRARAEAAAPRTRTRVSAPGAGRSWSLAVRTPWLGKGRSAHGGSDPRARGPGSASRARSRACRSCRSLFRDRCEHECLDGQIGIDVVVAHEGRDVAADQGFYRPGRLPAHHALDGTALLEDEALLAGFDELSLAVRERVRQQADDQVIADRGAGAGRPASAVLVEKVHHRARDGGRKPSRLGVSAVGAGHASLLS